MSVCGCGWVRHNGLGAVGIVAGGPKCPALPLSPDLHRCAVFCLLQIGTEIYDTEMVLADRTLADLCFENAVLL